ncbi:DUF4232 domain-containing protein [Streptomyces pinistramenti]|uniref:DUF4232 domain-containing protein n=1 Tax=Streptomyces pinistramenti TaxID=2884812 RepID=UPI001D06E462|nr:DUF4232 domain-containing protein [Streptomyces pinistramenti]MCB5909832.1 DUF4232 domain-containing protein [Streptomyces pinistramenti]
MSHRTRPRTLLRPVRTTAALTLAAAAALGLTACDIGGSDTQGASSSSAASSSDTSGGRNTGGQNTGGAGAAADGKAGGSARSAGGSVAARSAASRDDTTGRCSATALRMDLGRGDAGAGNIHYALSFTNTGKQSCTLRGFPGVALLARDGQAIGKPAVREGAAGQAVRLAAGASAYADLHTVNEGIKDGGCWQSASLVQAYPPGSTEAMTARAESGVRVCGDEFLVGALSEGNGG